MKFSKNAVLAVNELMKLAFCLFMATRDPQKHGGGGINATTRRRRRRAHLRAVVAGSRPMAVPAVVYLVVNDLPLQRSSESTRASSPRYRS